MRFAFSALFSSASLVALSACAPMHELDVSWTLQGSEATEDTCAPAVESVRVKAFSSSTRDGDKTESVASFDCSAGHGLVQTGSFADILVELMRGDTVVGGADLFSVAPSSGFLSEADAVAVDTRVKVGILTATLNVGGQSCGVAGASNFSVSLHALVSGLDATEVDTASASCTGGTATYTFDAARVGGTYLLTATTTKDGATWSTAGSGARIEITRPATGVGVNLIRTDDGN
jgi:hypothetical protein